MSRAGVTPSQVKRSPRGPRTSTVSPTRIESCRWPETTPLSRRSTVRSIVEPTPGAEAIEYEREVVLLPAATRTFTC